jgi:hypothetical protein
VTHNDVQALAASIAPIVAAEVADLVVRHIAERGEREFLDASELARVLGVDRQWSTSTSNTSGRYGLGTGGGPAFASSSRGLLRPSSVRCSGFVDGRRSRGGEIFYTLRLRIEGQRRRVTLGTAREGWTREAAEEKLRDTLGALRAGVALEVLFPPPEAAPQAATAEPTLGEVMDDYLADRRGSVSDRTLEADGWAIGHLRPFWGDLRPSEVTPQLVDRFRRQKVAEAEALRARIEAGERPVEARSYVRRSDGVRVIRRQPRKPLGRARSTR